MFKKILRKTLILSFFISLVVNNIQASLYFVTEENAVNADSFIIDFDDTASDYIDLEFGDALTARLRYDVVNNKFIFNENVDFEGNEIKNLRIENLASSPTCDANNVGRLYYNTTDKLTYSCDGVSVWNPLENALNATIEFPVVQARRTTSYTLTTTFTDIDLDTTDLENDQTTLDHDDTNRDRINIGATAMYQIIYGYTAGGSATSTHEARARVRVNDTTVLPGSASVNTNYQGEFSTTSASFLANLSDGDFISLQLQRDNTSDSTQDEIYFSIVKLEGIKGEKGEKGDSGSASPFTDSETFTIDNDNTGGDLSLIFGQSLNERLIWNSVNSEFNLSDDLVLGTNVAEDIYLGFNDDDANNHNFGWDDSENSLSTFGNELTFRTRQSNTPPVACGASFAGMQWMDTDSGILYICDVSNGRNKWLSTDEKVIFGDETGSCTAGADPNSNASCNVDWGNGLGPDGGTVLGFYIPRDITITGYGFSEDNDACTSGSFDLEIWGTGSNSDDNNYSFQQEIATGLTGQAHNGDSLNVNITGNQYILWGIDNNCGEDIDDWNLILYFRYRHD